MLAEAIRCVVGIDVAKAAHVVCVLAAPSGIALCKGTPIAANSVGPAQLCTWLHDWAGGDPTQVLIGLESTGSLWEPLDNALTQAGYMVLVLTPHQTAAWATRRGLRAKTDGIDAYTLACTPHTCRGRCSTGSMGRTSVCPVRRTSSAPHVRTIEVEVMLAALWSLRPSPFSTISNIRQCLCDTR